MKKYINKHSLTFAVLLGISLSSCKKEFTKLNTNPNSLEIPNDPTLVSNIEVNMFYASASGAWTLGNGMAQYSTFSQDYYNHQARYAPFTNQSYWDQMYSNARDANQLITDAKVSGNKSMQAVGLILRAYSFAQLTDLWGDIPFKQALNGANGNFAPAYDGQQTVYTDPELGVLPNLKTADDLLKTSTQAISGDLIYGGSVAKWRKFCDGLRLRYLLRVNGKLSSAAAEMQQIVADGANTLFSSPSESAELTLPTTVPYAFPSLTERSGDYSVKYLNSLLYTMFKNTGDQQRLSLLFAKNPNSQNATGFSFDNYGGMPIVANASSNQVGNSSNFNSAQFISNASPAVLRARVMTYQEEQFILAEASLKGLISTGTPIQYYNNGIKGAFADYGLDGTSYITNPGVVYDPAIALSQIITQKWIGNFNVAFEGWVEYRRTGFPVFDTNSGNLNNGKISSRFVYPTDEQSINMKNYAAEIAIQGGTDDANYKAWWEK
ncbi:MAG: SusD/RagB family nutrient-binding outer membrane lipoprotein [Bacteroidetes bacterium]|nr:SusD/RagB family nutrient-binding outer membrane lipoprotein [Bacteroidota bacterium]